ncbi:MAG TPA: hypothetical protein DCX19_01780, partial [Alphaproteobacteria bacterium]|nr:hypothetical protein [Alphaproteobacteria bacterium]
MDKDMQERLNAQARGVETRLRKTLGDDNYDTWLKSLSVGGFKDGVLTLFLPATFFCGYIARNFAGDITQAWRAENPSVTAVEF